MALASGHRRFVLWMAQLALIVYVVQLVAVDHWHPTADTAERHAQHCHGTSASCADGATLSPTNLATSRTPLPPEPRLYNVVPSVVSPEPAFIDTLLQPPRAA